MFELIFVIVMLCVLAGVGLVAFVIWTFRDVVFYAVEVVGYGLQAGVKVLIQGAVAIIGAVDDWLGDAAIAEEPLLRALVMAVVGLVCGVGLVQLLAAALNQPWVILTFTGTVGLGLILGLVADPDRDWSPGPFPSFTRSGGGFKLPLNL